VASETLGSVRSRNEALFNLAIATTFAVGTVWLIANRQIHWIWIAFTFLLTAVPQSAIVVARQTMRWGPSTLWGFALLALVAGAFRLAGWPVGPGSMMAFVFGIGAGQFLAAALRTHVERPRVESDHSIG
jgi:hypothetical protein